MKNIFFTVLIAVIALTVLPLSQHAQAPAQAEWTLMFYMDSDNDLEAPQMNDLDEMMGVGSTANINIIALVDRNVGGDEDDNYTNRAVGGIKNWTTAKYMVVEKGRLREIADLGELNMGDPENLANFIEATAKKFPAKRYGLVFGDHGSAWPGILHDEGNNDDSLNMAELSAALARATKTTGKLEMIGFDACLMGNFEVAKTVAPYAKALVGSQELEPGNGWDYKPFFTKLNANPTADGFALGRIAVDTFRDYYTLPAQGNRDASITLSVTDLSKIDALTTAVNELSGFSQAFIRTGGRASLVKTAGARSKTEDFGSSGKGKNVAEFFDLQNFAENIKLASGDPTIAKAADNVIAATKAAVIYKASGAAHPKANGLSIYFPSNAKTLTESGYTKTPFATGLKWSGMLMDYAGIFVNDTTKPDLKPTTTTNPNLAQNGKVVITSAVKGDDIDEATFVIAEQGKDETIIIGAIPTEPDEKGVLREEWDGRWFAISDGKNELICPITDFSELDNEKDIYYAEVPAQVQYKGRKEWHDITMYFVVDFNEEEATGEFVYAFQDKNGQQREVDLDTGDSIRPVYVSVKANGEMEDVAHTDPADILHITADDGLSIGMMDVAPGDYLLGFLVTDYAGNDNDNFVEVSVK